MVLFLCAGEGNRTHTPLGTRSEVWLVYQFQHARYDWSANILLFLILAKFDAAPVVY